MILRFLNMHGIGIAVSLALLGLLLLQKGETRHWRKQSGQFEQLYRGEQAALVGTVTNYRAAAEAARRADRAAAERVAAEQRAISERTVDDFKTRLGVARAAAERMRGQTRVSAADPGNGGTASMPGLPASAGRANQAPGQDGLPLADALTATEQAIQLDELIKWVRQQHVVDPNAEPRRPY